MRWRRSPRWCRPSGPAAPPTPSISRRAWRRRERGWMRPRRRGSSSPPHRARRVTRRSTVAARDPFQYALVRVVPRVERGESLNAGVVLFCRPRRYLAARTWLDTAALAVLAPACDPGEVQPHLHVVEAVAAGEV